MVETLKKERYLAIKWILIKNKQTNKQTTTTTTTTTKTTKNKLVNEAKLFYSNISTLGTILKEKCKI